MVYYGAAATGRFWTNGKIFKRQNNRRCRYDGIMEIFSLPPFVVFLRYSIDFVFMSKTNLLLNYFIIIKTIIVLGALQSANRPNRVTALKSISTIVNRPTSLHSQIGTRRVGSRIAWSLSAAFDTKKMATDGSKKQAKNAPKNVNKSNEEVIQGFQRLRTEQRQLASKLSELEMDLNEHK